jgi:hypothetical protein
MERRLRFVAFPSHLASMNKPTEHDIIAGPGERTNKHPGNRTFRNIVDSYEDRFNEANSDGKNAIANMISSDIANLNPRPRFMRNRNGDWIFLTTRAIDAKIKQRLRDKIKQRLRGARPNIIDDGLPLPVEYNEVAPPLEQAQQPPLVEQNAAQHNEVLPRFEQYGVPPPVGEHMEPRPMVAGPGIVLTFDAILCNRIRLYYHDNEANDMDIEPMVGNDMDIEAMVGNDMEEADVNRLSEWLRAD